MIRKCCTRFASFFGLSIKGTPFYFADLSDSSIHGEYVGINPLEASRGATLEECMVKFSLDKEGIYLYTNVPPQDATFEFRIHFTPSWVFRLRDWGVEHCLSVRQHAQSELAQLIFDFSGFSANGLKGDVLMLLGEGMPAVLGMFVRKTGNPHAESSVAKMYEAAYKPKEEVEKTSYLLPVNLAEAKLVMSSGNTAQKVQLLEKAAHNLWTGTNEEINARLELVKAGLKDVDPEVQEQALDTFTLGGRVVGGVELVVEFLRQHGSSDNYVKFQAIEAAVCLLYETYCFNKEVALLETEFGTSDIGAIHEATGGLISPQQYEAMKKIASTEPHRRWTLDHQRALRDAIKAVNPDVLAISEGSRALKDYPLPGSLPV